MGHFQIGGRSWLSQFIFGVPIIGKLSRPGVIQKSTKESPPLRDPQALFIDSIDRFESRAQSRATKGDNEVWAEVIDQVNCGWIEGPFDINEDGSLADKPNCPVNLVFCFPVFQQGNIRACDDCKRGRVNEFRSIDTHISLPNWAHVVECSKMIALSNMPWSYAVAVQKAAYKCEPIIPGHIQFCTLSKWNADPGKYVAFKPLTRLFRPLLPS